MFNLGPMVCAMCSVSLRPFLCMLIVVRFRPALLPQLVVPCPTSLDGDRSSGF